MGQRRVEVLTVVGSAYQVPLAMVIRIAISLAHATQVVGAPVPVIDNILPAAVLWEHAHMTSAIAWGEEGPQKQLK